MNRLKTYPIYALEPITDIFIANMSIMGHKFIIRCNGHLSEKQQYMWFDDIMEVLGIGTEKQG